jgi:uncharacterized protein YecT (DUF1311 family)
MSFLLLFALAAVQAPDQDWNCADPQTQTEMNACAAIDFRRADAELNRLWPSVIASERAADREINRGYDDRPTGEEMLRRAQRAWVTFRDAHCTVEGYENRGGTMEPLVYNTCRAALTRERIAQLSAPEQ